MTERGDFGYLLLRSMTEDVIIFRDGQGGTTFVTSITFFPTPPPPSERSLSGTASPA